MNEQVFDGSSASADGPTTEQAAILAYLGLPFDATTTRAQAAALIDAAENDPASRAQLQAWHRDKYRLHPDLFTPPQRSFREGRWWQSRISDDNLYGYSFRQPSLSQTLVILESLDAREPGWERESKNRREARFMNELATLSPELCKSGCAYPQELPADDPTAPSAAAAPAGLPAPRVPSAPFIPGSVAAPAFTPPALPSKPSWTPGASAPTQSTKTLELTEVSTERRGGRRIGWLPWALLLAVVGLVGAAGYVWSHRGEPELSVQATPSPSSLSSAAASPKPSGTYAPLSAKESRQRAIAKHPELAQAGTPLNAKFIAAYRILESQHSPRLLQPDWPEQLADEFAATPAPVPAVAPRAAAASTVPVATPRVAASPTPAVPRASSPASGTTPPAAQRTMAVAPVTAPVVLAAPPVALPPNAPPVSAPAGVPFVTLDATNKTRANNYSYSWSPFYYADYDISFRQTVGIEAKVRNMTHGNTAVILRWMFFGRKTSNNERYVFAAAQKRLELAAGQSVADTLDSPMLQSKAAVGYSYGMHYYSGSKYEGWLVQVLPEGGDQVLKQVGSSGYIEDFGKRSDLTALLKEQLAR